MFEQEDIYLFGRKAILIKDQNNQTSMTIIPSAGGHLASLVFEGREIIDGFQNETEVGENEGFKSALLYPFPNRLKQGSYTNLISNCRIIFWSNADSCWNEQTKYATCSTLIGIIVSMTALINFH